MSVTSDTTNARRAIKPSARTIPALLHEMAARFPAREALVSSGKRYTYAELVAETRTLAKALHASGVGPGDKVAILMGNRPEWLLSYFAATYIGAVAVAINTWVTTRELAHQLSHSDASVLIVASPFLKYDYLAMLEDMAPLAQNAPQLKQIVTLGPGTIAGDVAYPDMIARARAVPDGVIDAFRAAVQPESIACILYTSGSTALPKGVVLQHYALIENLWNVGERMHATEEDRVWLAVSLFWGVACQNALFNITTHGGCIVLQEHFEAGEALRLIEAERCTIVYAMPNMIQALSDHPDRPSRDLSSLRTGGTIGSPEQMQRAIDLGIPQVCQMYGLTETYANCCIGDAWDSAERRKTCVGRPLPDVDLQIVDLESEEPLPRGSIGEIRVKGYLALGYYKDDEKSREVIDPNGYFRTGDLGIVDDEGYVHFRGRIKEMIKTGGINVSPVEVEEVLSRHASVLLAYVVGVPDAARDELVGAVIVLRDGTDIDRNDLIEHCKRDLAGYKVPRQFLFVREPDLPLTVTGKVQKSELFRLFGKPAA